MSKKYVGTAKKIAEINVNIVAENEEEKYKHSDIYEINSCEKCECFCPVCHSCMIDE